MSDISISADAISVKPVNDDPPDPHDLPDMIRLALDRLEGAVAAVSKVVSAADRARTAAGDIDDQAAVCEFDAIVDAISDIDNSLDDVRRDLEAVYAERAPEGDGVVDVDDIEGDGEGDKDEDDDEVAGYLAVDPSTSDRVIEGFIAAVGADRVLGALDRLTAPVNANTAN